MTYARFSKIRGAYLVGSFYFGFLCLPIFLYVYFNQLNNLIWTNYLTALLALSVVSGLGTAGFCVCERTVYRSYARNRQSAD